MKYNIDLHTHTVASGHAFCTLSEMIQAAADKHVEWLGITEHSSGFPYGCNDIYFENLYMIPRKQYGVNLLLGAEMNILNTAGDLDVNENIISNLDLRIAGVHSLCYQQGTREENTAGMIKVIRNPLIHIISHPGDGTTELDFLPIVLAAKECHTLLEINNSSLKPIRKKINARSNNLEILRLCKEYEVPITLGSDAHFTLDIAEFSLAAELINEIDFPNRLIMNNSMDEIRKYLSL